MIVTVIRAGPTGRFLYETDSGCYNYRGLRPKPAGTKSQRRPQITVQTRVYSAAKYVYEYVFGPVGGQNMLHRCDNPRCVRLEHLFPGDALANALDRDSKGRGILGKARQELRRFSAEQVRDIRSRWSRGSTQTALAAEFGVSHRTVWQIVRRVSYADVD